MAPPVDVQNRDGTSHSGLENFLVLLKSGEYVPLKDFSKHHHESKTVSFNKSKNSYSFSPKLDWKKLKSEGNFLIYADQYDAHHLDKKRKSTLHVFQLSKLN